MTSKSLWVVSVLLFCMLRTVNAQSVQIQSEPAGLQITIESQMSPIPLNQMHSWTITIVPETPIVDIRTWETAIIHVSGGMPAHNHGLATSPQVTEYLGEGRFLLEGVRFHMAGVWILQLQIQLDNKTYSAHVELTI